MAPGLDAGAITGIVIGSLAAVALIAFAGWYFFLRKGMSSPEMMTNMGATFGAGAGSAHDRVGAWTFKSLIYGQPPNYDATGAEAGEGYAMGGPKPSMWMTPGNPLGLSWITWGLITLVSILAITGIALGIAAGAGAFNGDPSPPPAAPPPPPA